jgi:hypothetical protein
MVSGRSVLNQHVQQPVQPSQLQVVTLQVQQQQLLGKQQA